MRDARATPDVKTIFDEIHVASWTINGLLRLARNELISSGKHDAEAAILAAMRLVDDVFRFADDFVDTRAAEASRIWREVSGGHLPNDQRDVLVWSTKELQPHAAFYDSEENVWFSKYDGLRLSDDTVSHWCEIHAPKGVSV